MIRKRSLQNWLAKKGLTKEVLIDKERKLRENGNLGKHPSGVEGVYYYVSSPEKYSEAPINLVVRKSILERCAGAYYEIRPTWLKRLK